ncbi:MAG: selenocysteine-specific translation elongation factor [Actinomycetota bacterium]|nr:selenocysteine-specific translation elongation factor [Actinomycetota bacterium]
MSDGPLTLGTAGHIDHGKTALVRALTGVDTDRLPQERTRGISIELGYASLALPSGRRLSVIDVPGHERFVRTMVAGATGIDLHLMTVAADDGVMPQTREHAAVLAALGVTQGVVAVTKSDLADPQQAMLEAAELLPGAELVPVSIRTEQGLAELRAALERAAAAIPSRAELPGPARLHVDRAFSIRGAGTVVTGTLWSGSVARGDQVTVLPHGLRSRVRAVQIHDAAVEGATAGQRVALNLAGIAVGQIGRGDVVVAAGSELRPAYLLDCELEFLTEREPDPGDRVQVHHGTREAPGRLAWLGGRFWQVRLEQPLIAAFGDRLVIRRISPPDTLGGGRVLDPRPRKHGPSRDILAWLTARATDPNVGPAHAHASPASRVRYPHRSMSQRPLAPRPERQPEPLTPTALALEQRLKEAGLEPPPDAELDPADLAALRRAGRAVRVSRTLHYHPEALDRGREQVLALALAGAGQVTLAQVRDELATSRKFAQALLEHLDSERVLIRRGDVHVLRRAAADSLAP